MERKKKKRVSNNKSYFVSWQSDFGFAEREIQKGSIAVKLNHNYKQHQFYFQSDEQPYLSLVNDNSTPKLFLDALIKKDFQDAMTYISRLSLFVDQDALKEIFDNVKSYNYIPVSYKNSYFPKGEKVNSVFISNENKKKILHFYLINEPDYFSKWKIYRIEEENVTGNFERKKIWIKF